MGSILSLQPKKKDRSGYSLRGDQLIEKGAIITGE
jgi:hypothetical protein